MMQLRSTRTNTVMEPEDVVKLLSILQRKISCCLRPNRALAQSSSYEAVISECLIETDTFVASSLTWDNIFGISFPTKEGEM